MQRSLKLSIALLISLTGLLVALGSLASASGTPPDTAPAAPPPARPANPASGVYTLYDSLTGGDVPTATFQWVEINSSADDTWDLGGDFAEDKDLSPSFDIGFIFPFYDNLYTNFRISEKGFLLFDEAGVDVGDGGLPATIPDGSLGSDDGANNFIAPFAGDLFGYPNISNVYVRRDTSPRRTIIEFENVVWCCGQNNPRTFQVILYPDGSIDMQYLTVTGFPTVLDTGQVVRVGLEDLTGGAGDVYTQGRFSPTDATFWQDNLALRYERSLSEATVLFLPDSRTVWDDPDHLITLNPQLYFLADPGTSSDFDIITSSLVVSSTLPVSDWNSNITLPPQVTDLSGTFSETIQLDLTIPAGAGLNDVATATFVAQSTSLPVSGTFVVTYGVAQRDLRITKTLDPDIPPADGGALRYRLDIANSDYNNSGRSGEARQVVVSDTLPAGVVYEDCSGNCNGISTSTVSTRTLVTWDVGTMAPDQNRTIYLELRNSNPGGTLITNTAAITLNDGVEIGYPDGNNDSDSLTVAGSVASDLEIRKVYPYPFNGQNFVGSGQVIPFRVVFYNAGSQGRTGNAPVTATLVDTLPPGTTFDRATTGSDYNDPQLTPVVSGPMSRTITFQDVAVDNGDWNRSRIWVWISVPQTTPVGTLLENKVTIDDGVSQDEATETVEVASNFADPFVEKSPSVDNQGNVIAPEPGSKYTYWVTYGNRSVLVDATDFVMTDTLPAEVTFADATTDDYLTGPVTSTVSGRTLVVWRADVLTRGTTGQVLVTVNVPEDLPKGTPLVNEIAITYTGTFTPSDGGDDTDTITTEVASDIVGSAKIVDDGTPNPGDTVAYTIQVSNTGSAATPFTVTDVLPADLTYVSHDNPTQGAVTINGDTISWTGGTVAENGQATLTFRATITDSAVADQVIRNTAQIQGAGVTIERSVNVVISTDTDDSDGTIYLPAIYK